MLIPSLGLRATTGVGIALNLAATAAAIAISQTEAAEPAALPSPDGPRATPPRPARSRSKGRRGTLAAVDAPRPPWLPITIAAVAGFVTLVFEVAFTRLLAVALGPTSYAIFDVFRNDADRDAHLAANGPGLEAAAQLFSEPIEISTSDVIGAVLPGD